MGREADLVKPRFARGCRCFAVFLDGTVAGYGWLSTGPEWIGELELEIRPRKGEAYIWNCVTLPKHRRRGIFKSLVAGISIAARQSGVTRLWIGTLAIPGESAVAPLGFRPAARFRTLRLLGLFAVTGSIVDSDARRVVSFSFGRSVLFGAVTRRRH